MPLATFNTFLLSVLIPNEDFESNIKVLLRRNQALSIIYISFGLFLNALLYQCVLKFIFNSPTSYYGAIIILPFWAMSLILLKAGKTELAGYPIIFQMHLLDTLTGVDNQPFIGFYGLVLSPALTFLLIQPLKARLLSIFCTWFQYFYHVKKILMVFQVTLTQEQSQQIHLLFYFSMIIMMFLCLVFSVQKSIEENTWKIAEEHYKKSEKLFEDIQAKDAFVSSLSHEVRNPLNSMSGSIEYLLQVIKDPVQLAVLERAKISGEVLLNIINNALDAAKLRADKMELCYTASDFCEVLKKILVVNSEDLLLNEVFVRGFIDKSLPKLLWIDSSRILQVVMNLISNAIKFTQKGAKINIKVTWCGESTDKDTLLRPSKFLRLSDQSSPIHSSNDDQNSPQAKDRRIIKDISCQSLSYEYSEQDDSCNPVRRFISHGSKTMTEDSSTQAEDKQIPWVITRASFFRDDTQGISDDSSRQEKKGFLKFEILDNGIGIPEASIPRLFGMFAQTNEIDVASIHGGAGLGLWICKQLCNKMGGDIAAYSELNKGTSCVFYLPVDNTQLPDVPNKAISRRREQIRALVVDDYEYNRSIHKLLLEKEGVEVELASNGREAVEMYKSKEEGYFNFIFMDIQMPIMDGFEATKLIKRYEHERTYKATSVYFVSGEYYKEEDIQGKIYEKPGAIVNNDLFCIKKPISVRCIKQLLSELN